MEIGTEELCSSGEKPEAGEEAKEGGRRKETERKERWGEQRKEEEAVHMNLLLIPRVCIVCSLHLSTCNCRILGLTGMRVRTSPLFALHSSTPNFLFPSLD